MKISFREGVMLNLCGRLMRQVISSIRISLFKADEKVQVGH